MEGNKNNSGRKCVVLECNLSKRMENITIFKFPEKNTHTYVV